MIVTIDGPAGTGKSTVARQLANVLGYEYLDTGAMYRMIACEAVASDLDPHQQEELAQLASRTHIEFRDGAALLNGVDVSTKLREPEIALAASVVAQNADVRQVLVQRQRELAANRNIVCEGRDQGTVVFPAAECKFYLTASPEIRARRRQEELTKQGKNVDYEQLLAEQNERDHRDENREVAPLKPAPDAEIVDTSDLTIDNVVAHLKQKVVSVQRS